MTDTSDDKRHFFISFNKADRDWATWIAWVLEEKGYSVFFQDWDFRGRAPPPEKNARIAVAAAPLSRIALLIDSCENCIAALELLLTFSLLFGLPPTIALPLDCLRFRGGRSTWLNRRIPDEGRRDGDDGRWKVNVGSAQLHHTRPTVKLSPPHGRQHRQPSRPE